MPAASASLVLPPGGRPTGGGTVAETKPSSAHDGGAPGHDELVELLGRSHAAFRALTHDRAGATCEWKRYSRKGPWALKVSEGDRTLFYLVPQADQFEVTVVLGRRATDAALAGRVRSELHATIRSAKPYVEGRPVKVLVTGREDLAAVEELVAVKLRPQMPSTDVAPQSSIPPS
jgi:hypothetical protein